MQEIGKKLFWGMMLGAVLGMLSPAAASAQTRSEQDAAASEAAVEWLRFMDIPDYPLAWEEASAIFREGISVDQWQGAASQVYGRTGPVTSRRAGTIRHTMDLPDAPPGNYVILEFNSEFERMEGIETVVLREESAGWKVVGYFIRPG